jgi:hypothetical protein
MTTIAWKAAMELVRETRAALSLAKEKTVDSNGNLGSRVMLAQRSPFVGGAKSAHRDKISEVAQQRLCKQEGSRSPTLCIGNRSEAEGG